MRRCTLAIAALVVSTAQARAQGFRLPGFQSAAELRLVSSAEIVEGRVRLTPAKTQKAGAVWHIRKQIVGGGFDTSFRFQLTEQGGLGNGADGFAFVVQNTSPRAIAGRGSAGGFALGDGQNDRSKSGIPHSIAVFFDTFHNGDGKDPSDNYLAICSNGGDGKMLWPPPRLAVAHRLNVVLKDGRIHSARIVYKPPVMSVYLDDPHNPALTAVVDLGTVVDKEGKAFVGFTASTGGGFENHDILDWSFMPGTDISATMVTSEISFSLTHCLESRNLCTPADAIVEETGPGKYRVVLPAHLEWGASVPNLLGRPVMVRNARGVACWDLQAQGTAGCGGSSGHGPAPHDALAPTESAGALIARTRDGRTYFSLNDRRASGFADNQGFFEFEVEVQ